MGDWDPRVNQHFLAALDYPPGAGRPGPLTVGGCVPALSFRSNEVCSWPTGIRR
jgi:hypothetical protein